MGSFASLRMTARGRGASASGGDAYLWADLRVGVGDGERDEVAEAVGGGQAGDDVAVGGEHAGRGGQVAARDQPRAARDALDRAQPPEQVELPPAIGDGADGGRERRP